VGLGRRIVRKTVRKATSLPVRHAMHSVRTVERKVAPRPIRQATYTAYNATHPAAAAENKRSAQSSTAGGAAGDVADGCPVCYAGASGMSGQNSIYSRARRAHSGTMHIRIPLAAFLSLPAAALMLAAPAPAASASPVTALPCHASMSNSRPKDYTTTDVRVSTAGKASVTTVAHYRTVTRKHHRTANAKGRATVPYYISGATPGYRVKVDVYVSKGKRTASCSTSFTPRR
jgi:hypothetical protein